MGVGRQAGLPDTACQTSAAASNGGVEAAVGAFALIHPAVLEYDS